MSSIRVLIIDDEETICRGVEAKLLRVCGSSLASVHWTTDPSKADAIVAEKQIDLVLCDIRMPAANGIDVLVRLRSIKPSLVTAIITGVDDFEHARAAIRLGVAAYLLKPIDSQELGELMAGAMGTLEQRNRDEARRTLIETDGWLRSALEEGRPDLLSRAGFSFNGGACLVIGAAGHLEPDTKPLIAELLLRRRPGQETRRFYPFDAGTRGVGCVALFTADASPEAVASEAGRYLRSETGQRLVVAVSRFRSRQGELPEAWQEAVSAFRYRLVASGSVALAAAELANRRICAMTDDEQLLINRVVGMTDQDLSTERVLELFDPDRLARSCPRYFAELYAYVRASLDRHATAATPLPPIDHLVSLAELRSRLWEALEDARAAIVRGERDRVSAATEYVERHFAENIDMQTVCERVGLSYAYFSRAFKDRYGLNFHEYLTELRLRAADALLPRPELSLDEVARRIGYTNRKSFVRAYKRVHGYPPRRNLAVHE